MLNMTMNRAPEDIWFAKHSDLQITGCEIDKIVFEDAVVNTKDFK